MAHRPRASILSLFDPLSLSPVSDKENNVGESSFFHPPGSRTTAVQHTLRRRLIDVGDITVDEPDMLDLLAMEDELEEINNNITENDDGDTLTWRDMAKAATPKWSGRHATSFTTPKGSPTPRTPLAELSFKDETTPMARKKSYRRQIIPAPSKLARMESPPTSPLAVDFPSSNKTLGASNNTNIPNPSAPIATPSIEISDADPDTQSTLPPAPPLQDALGSSVCTLNLPPSAENLIADSSLPLDISPSSSQSSQSPSTLLSLPPSQPRPRPNALSPANNDNRMSVDLQSSFQLHLNSSDTTFDLLNEKISFFSSKNGIDSFLHNLEIDSSFGEDDLKLQTSYDSDAANNKGEDAIGRPILKAIESTKNSSSVTSKESKCSESNRVFVPKLHPAETCFQDSSPIVTQVSVDDIHDSHSSPTPSNDKKFFPVSPASSHDGKESTLLSTPSATNSLLPNPPRPVPALKIVKRSKLVSRRLSTAVNAISATTSTSTSTSAPSRRTSVIPSSILPGVRAKDTATIPPSPADSGNKLNGISQHVAIAATKKSAATSTSNSLSGDGPRRVLVSEGPKLISLANSKAVGSADSAKAANGPRRIAANSAANITEKPIAGIKPVAHSQPSTGLRQPVKCGIVGSSSAIPKPVSRTAGSRLPAPAIGTSKSRFGVSTAMSSAPTRELQGRRVT